MPSISTTIRSRITYANVVGSLALFVALGGSTYAAATIGADSIKDNAVHSNHIADGQVKNADLAAGSIGTGKVIDGSLLAQDFKAGQLPGGPAGRGAITFDRTDGEFAGVRTIRYLDGVSLLVSCNASGVGYVIADEDGVGSGGSGIGVVGTKQLDLGNPSGVHTGGSYVGFPGSTAMDLDVMGENNEVGKWVGFKLYSIHRPSQHNCSFGGMVIPPS
jgi:hypothetical protein